jgi:hypothetical protein
MDVCAASLALDGCGALLGQDQQAFCNTGVVNGLALSKQGVAPANVGLECSARGVQTGLEGNKLIGFQSGCSMYGAQRQEMGH